MADPNLLLGFETSDDAAIYQVAPDLATVMTVDFLTPLVDDPYDFGRVAASNALSDVYAMGGRPTVALNVLALDCALGTGVARDILRGGADAVADAGAAVCGGHTIDDPEPKYGLCVFGLVDPARVVRNVGAHEGDALYLTKRIGTGLLSAAYKIGECTADDFAPAIESMSELNRAASEAMLAANVHAATDVTGFALAGHLHEMVEGSGLDAVLDFDAIPLFDKAWELNLEYCRPSRTFTIMDFAEGFISQGTLDDEELDNRMGVMCDPQTSGGMLVALSSQDAAVFEREFAQRSGRAPWRIGRFEKGSGFIRFADA